ncbi:MAG: hypothetical protein IJ049_03555 [Oscillospiraceae bacterium]|nr:hypothetical protein [Oscillospiraceae bacterium]
MSSCFFIGHRDAPASILPQLIREAECHVTEYAVTDFYVGHYGIFDQLAGKAVIQLKERFPDIRLYRVIPYHPAERPIQTPNGYDGSYYPPNMENVPRRFAIPRANRSLIDTSDYLIAYVCHPASNAYEILRYAKMQEKKGLIQVVNLGDKDDLL